MKKYISILLITTLLGSVITGCTQSEPDVEVQAQITKTPVEVVRVVSSDLSNSVKLTGKVSASREVMVFPPIPSNVEKLNVNVGDNVKKGQSLFVLDKDDVSKQYAPLKESYDSTKELAEKTLIQLETNYQNTLALFEIGAASQIQVDQAELSLLQQRVTLDSQLSSLETNMDSIQDTLVDTTVTAPITGVVTAVNIVENMLASNTQAAVVISDISQPQVYISIAETLIAYIKEGSPVSITIPSVSSDPINAVVRSVSPSTDMQTGMYTIKIDLPTDQEYTMGMFVEATFNTDSATETLIIPTNSVLNDGTSQYVFVANESDGTVRKVIVTTGINNGENTQITSGLTGEELIVCTGQDYLTDQSLVTITGGL